MVTLVCAALGTLALSVSHRANWAECVHAFVQEAGSQLPLRHRTHSIERAPDDLLSPKSLIKEAQAAMLLEAPAQNPFSPLSQACKQPSGSAHLRRCVCHSFTLHSGRLLSYHTALTAPELQSNVAVSLSDTKSLAGLLGVVEMNKTVLCACSFAAVEGRERRSTAGLCASAHERLQRVVW